MSKLLLESMTPKMESRALAVQGMLAERGFHRPGEGVPDLLIAAVAEMSGYTVLRTLIGTLSFIAEVTGQPIELPSMPSWSCVSLARRWCARSDRDHVRGEVRRGLGELDHEGQRWSVDHLRVLRPGGGRSSGSASTRSIRSPSTRCMAATTPARPGGGVHPLALVTGVLLLLFATAVLAVSLFLPEQQAVLSNGILLGGVFTMAYAVGMAFAADTSLLRFGVVTVALQ